VNFHVHVMNLLVLLLGMSGGMRSCAVSIHHPKIPVISSKESRLWLYPVSVGPIIPVTVIVIIAAVISAISQLKFRVAQKWQHNWGKW